VGPPSRAHQAAVNAILALRPSAANTNRSMAASFYRDEPKCQAAWVVLHDQNAIGLINDRYLRDRPNRSDPSRRERSDDRVVAPVRDSRADAFGLVQAQQRFDRGCDRLVGS
jgi:hypothetical protein